MSEKIKVAVVGGGCGALSAVFELTDPNTSGSDRYEVTVYQMGWRLGGKGASGRNKARKNRTEEHGLHVWMGFYENAFRWVRRCYAELSGDPAQRASRFANWDDAFIPDPWVGVAEKSGGEWRTWSGYFPEMPGQPGDPLEPDTNPFTLTHYVERSSELLRALMQSVFFRRKRTLDDPHESTVDFSDASPQVIVEKITSVLRTGVLSGIGALYEAAAIFQVVLSGRFSLPNGDYLVLKYAEAISSSLKRQAEVLFETDQELRPKLDLIELVITVIVGILRDELLSDPLGLDAINDEDCRAWLRRHGASSRAVESAFVRALYNVAFADHPDHEAPPAEAPGVRGKDSERSTDERISATSHQPEPSSHDSALFTKKKAHASKKGSKRFGEIAAGQALRGALRFFFTYRGSLFWKMRASMGDAVFSPMYEVLKKRGVKFEFFHELVDVVPSGFEAGESPHIAELVFHKQARVKRGQTAAGKKPLCVSTFESGEYYPLDDDGCWPSKPDFSQLEDRDGHPSCDFESPGVYQTESAELVRLKVRASREITEGFDFVVLGVSLGALQTACPTLIGRDERWRAMVQNVKTVATQALQLWTTEGLETLTAIPDPITVAAFRSPFDTWSDMTHVIAEEGWGKLGEPPDAWPKGLSYFCGVLPDTSDPLQLAPPWLNEHDKDAARKRVVKFLDNSLTDLWPGAVDAVTGEFRWQALSSFSGPPGVAAGEPLDMVQKLALLDDQFLAFNVKPSDRYVLSRPHTLHYRISPLDNTYDNFTIAGDWTDCGFNEGCAEAAVMSGMLAAHSLSGSPELQDIIGYDHP